MKGGRWTDRAGQAQQAYRQTSETDRLAENLST